ncbi:helix-turn-helix domain-containing protein [Roseateles puraquae]|uniref:Transcriptional regulator n=1 Tax=Roseateles puraquae TaxID=431059 RepID=A0A254NA99_9BURK|nr:helix-turn-helix transcriptional regulator [Roseateles puraquae]MDG0854778.1 XRE family transcriptional regulator [Roseateles puraquae]OWR04926.1 transcriptional regulator [Roseateles puraquae]
MSQKPFPPPYDILRELLVAARQSAGLTQDELAARLLIGQSAVSKVERGAQRLDLVELHRWLLAIGAPSITSFVQAFEKRVGEQIVAERRWARSRTPTRQPTRQASGARKRST